MNTKLQLGTLVFLRFLIGWHMLYEGISKLLNPNWSSLFFLQESQWIMSGFAKWIISNPQVLNIVDILNTWGLIAIGLGLILGIFTRIASISGVLLLLMYYLNNAPIPGIDYSIPMESDYLIVNKTLVEAAALLVLAVFPTSSVIGMDWFLNRLKNRIKNKKVKNGK